MQEQTKKISTIGIVVWLSCLTFYLYEFFLRTFVGTLAGNIITDMKLTPEEFALMGSAYYITYSFMQLPAGYLTDKFGAKKIVISAMFLCSLSVFIFQSSNGFLVGFLARFLMGFGSSFGFITLLVVITNWFPPRLYGIFIGVSQFVGTLGPLLAAGPLISILKASNLTWRPFFLRVSFFGILLSFLFIFLFRSKARNLQSDMVFLKKPMSLLHQLKTLFRNKQVWFLAFFSALAYESVDFLGAMWGTFYLQSRGLSLSMAGYTISAGWLGFAIGCPLTTLFSEMVKRRKPVLLFCSLLGFAASISITYFQLYFFWIYPLLFFCIGLAASALNLGIAIMIEHVEVSIKALALGFNNGLIILFGAIVPISTSYLINLPTTGSPSPKDFLVGFSVLPLMYLVAFILALFFIEETFCRPRRGSIILKA